MSDYNRELHRFHNRLRILRSIDRDEIDAALSDGKLAMDATQWTSFRDSPYESVLRASDGLQAAIWKVVEGREV
jgi:hypothetical protein